MYPGRARFRLFIIARRSELMACKGVSRSLSLDIYDQWETMEKRSWQVAFHLAYPRGTRLQGSHGRAEGRRGWQPVTPVTARTTKYW